MTRQPIADRHQLPSPRAVAVFVSRLGRLPNPLVKPTQLKKLLVSAGFQVFRTLGSQVLLADRVRDNLVMDSGVAVVLSKELSIRVTMRAQASDYPRETEKELLARARELMASAAKDDYSEVETAVVPIPDPSEPSKELDTYYEVTFEKRGIDADSLPAELRRLLGLKRLA